MLGCLRATPTQQTLHWVPLLVTGKPIQRQTRAQAMVGPPPPAAHTAPKQGSRLLPNGNGRDALHTGNAKREGRVPNACLLVLLLCHVAAAAGPLRWGGTCACPGNGALLALHSRYAPPHPSASVPSCSGPVFVQRLSLSQPLFWPRMWRLGRRPWGDQWSVPID